MNSGFWTFASLTTALCIASIFPAGAQTVTERALRTNGYLNSIGINVHLNSEWDTAYSDVSNGGDSPVGTDPAAGAVNVNGTVTNVSKILAAVKYTNTLTLRTSLAGYVGNRFGAIRLGIPSLRTDVITDPSIGSVDSQVNAADSMPAAVAEFEGINEGTDSAQYEGLQGAPADCQWQIELRAAVNSWNATYNRHAPLLAPSVGNSSGFAQLAAIPGCVNASTAANAHVYTNASSPTSTFRAVLPSSQMDAPSGAPIYISETGLFTNTAYYGGVDETTQAKLFLDGLLAARKNLHVTQTLIYELVDEFPTDDKLGPIENHYGIFHNDWTPKFSAAVLHAQDVLLADHGPQAGSFTTQSLKYTIAGAPSTTYTLLTQRSDGTFFLIAWTEPNAFWIQPNGSNPGMPVVTPPTTANIVFGKTFSKIQTADFFSPGGLDGSGNPVLTPAGTNTSNVSVQLSDHPVYMVLSP